MSWQSVKPFKVPLNVSCLYRERNFLRIPSAVTQLRCNTCYFLPSFIFSLLLLLIWRFFHSFREKDEIIFCKILKPYVISYSVCLIIPLQYIWDMKKNNKHYKVHRFKYVPFPVAVIKSAFIHIVPYVFPVILTINNDDFPKSICLQMITPRGMKWNFILNWIKVSVRRVKLRSYFSPFQVMDQYVSIGMKVVSQSHKHPIGWTDFSKKTYFLRRRGQSYSGFNNASLQRRRLDQNDVITLKKAKSTNCSPEWQMRILTGFR